MGNRLSFGCTGYYLCAFFIYLYRICIVAHICYFRFLLCEERRMREIQFTLNTKLCYKGHCRGLKCIYTVEETRASCHEGCELNYTNVMFVSYTSALTVEILCKLNSNIMIFHSVMFCSSKWWGQVVTYVLCWPDIFIGLLFHFSTILYFIIVLLFKINFKQQSQTVIGCLVAGSRCDNMCWMNCICYYLFISWIISLDICNGFL